MIAEHLGYSVDLSGDEAYLQDVIAGGEVIDDDITAALLGISADASKNGIQICRQLLDLSPGLKIVAMIGSIAEPVLKNCKSYGFAGSLLKPFTIDDLKNVLNAL